MKVQRKTKTRWLNRSERPHSKQQTTGEVLPVKITYGPLNIETTAKVTSVGELIIFIVEKYRALPQR